MFFFIALNMRKKVFWISFILFVFSSNAISDRALAADPVFNYDTVIRVSSTELFDDYNNNEVAADMKYKGKHLAVDGTIDAISKDIWGSVYITIGTKRLFGTVTCYYDDKKYKANQEFVARLSKGARVTVIGIGGGMLMQTPRIRKCYID
ncbi:MAG: OB-fold putative lipoprotein [Deltaproteobacteria bacterium]|jgi:hypothetical protein|nr:OB-fold putative lipoprotein [Deltaproteobacteria bacterium]